MDVATKDERLTGQAVPGTLPRVESVPVSVAPEAPTKSYPAAPTAEQMPKEVSQYFEQTSYAPPPELRTIPTADSVTGTGVTLPDIESLPIEDAGRWLAEEEHKRELKQAA